MKCESVARGTKISFNLFRVQCDKLVEQESFPTEISIIEEGEILLGRCSPLKTADSTFNRKSSSKSQNDYDSFDEQFYDNFFSEKKTEY